MKKSVMYFGQSVLAPYRHNTEWPEWSQGLFRDAVMYYLTSNLEEKDPALGLSYLGDLLDRFIEENECNRCQVAGRVSGAVRIFRRLKLIRNRLAHPGKSENVVAWRHRLIPLCLQVVHVVMNDLHPARRLDDSSGKLVVKVKIGRSLVSSTASDPVEKAAFCRSVQKRNRDIVNNFLKAVPTKKAILDLSFDELARLLENQVMAPTIIHDGDGASFEVPLGAVSKGVCEYESSPEGWRCCARNECEDPWKDDKWSYDRLR